MNRSMVLAVAALLVLASTALAQHGGHGGGHRGSPGAGDTSDAGLVDFNRALAYVQATGVNQEHGGCEEAGADGVSGKPIARLSFIKRLPP